MWNELIRKPHPYQWMIDNNATARLHEEIGTDPAAYEAQISGEMGGGDGRRAASGVARRWIAAVAGERADQRATGDEWFRGATFTRGYLDATGAEKVRM